MSKLRYALVLLFAFACAQDVGDVDRTQPNRIKKSVFAGEWYLQKTTFDVPYTAGFTFTGETSLVERVRWEIQEQHLIAYRTHELVENTLAPSQLPDTQFEGAPIAAYAISSHFDVVREYDALTGEESNVISENTTDRPWYEREYVRVNWSRNLVGSFAFLDDQIAQSPMDYFVQDRDDADRLLLGVRDPVTGQWTDHQDWEAIAALDTADYIDVVDTLFAAPELAYEYDEYGDLYEYPACWFYASSDCQPSRIKVRSSFMKVREDDAYEAMAFPDNYIARDANGNPVRDEYGDPVRVPMFDLFGYFRTERDNYDRDRERTETGRTFLINRWSLWTDAPACKGDSESYANCTPRPIIYYFSPGFPEALKPMARAVVHEWNVSFKEVVNQLKYGGTRTLDQIEEMFVILDNAYVPGEVRGQRIGDLRYSFLYWVDEPQAVGPLGYGPAAVDPISGRIIQATAYVYGAGIESWAAWGADTVQLINGAISPDDFLEGEDVRSYVARARGDYASLEDTATAGRDRVDGARSWAASDVVRKGRAKQKALGKRGMRLDRGKVRAKLRAIERTSFEERLLNDEIVRALKPSTRMQGADLLSSLSPAERERMSPARWGTRGAMRAMHEKRRLKMRKANLYMAEFADDGVIGLAESLKGNDWQTVRNTIVESLFRSTAEHEIGHTVGLRHNFAGSFDAINYHPEYWAMRGNAPQPFTDKTSAQAIGRMGEFSYASIMDYSARFNSDIHGLGHYDRAAILFGYGQLVETFEVAPDEPLAELFGLEYALHELRHYSGLPRVFGGDINNMYRRRVVPYADIVAQMRGESQAGAVMVPYRFCSDEYEGAIPSCNTYDEGADSWEVVRNAARHYENYYIFNSFARDRREVSPWNHLDRVYYRYFLFGQLQYQDFVYRSFDIEPLWDAYVRPDAQYYNVENLPFDQAVDGNLAGALASQEGLDMLARVIQTPEPGAYYFDTDENVFYNFTYDQTWDLCPPGQTGDDCSDLNVDLGTGKYAFSLYDGASGYYFYDRVRVVGSFYDKLAALQALTSPETYFLGVDADANLTQYAISMYLFFPDQVTRLVGGSAVESYDAFAGVVRNQVYEPRDMFAAPSMYAGVPSVDPATSFTIELYSTWLGMAFLNANFDNSFNDSMRIFEEGSGTGFDPTVTDPNRIARYTHARSGRTFVAVRHEDPNRYSPAYDLLTRTQARADTTTDPALKEYYEETAVAIIETLRGMHALYGQLYF